MKKRSTIRKTNKRGGGGASGSGSRSRSSARRTWVEDADDEQEADDEHDDDRSGGNELAATLLRTLRRIVRDGGLSPPQSNDTVAAALAAALAPQRNTAIDGTEEEGISSISILDLLKDLREKYDARCRLLKIDSSRVETDLVCAWSDIVAPSRSLKGSSRLQHSGTQAAEQEELLKFGSYSIVFDDGDIDHGVLCRYIRPHDDLPDQDPVRLRHKATGRFAVNDRIMAQFQSKVAYTKSQ